MAQDGLHRAQVSTVFHHVRGAGMTRRVCGEAFPPEDTICHTRWRVSLLPAR